jgi:hypothetical protein
VIFSLNENITMHLFLKKKLKLKLVDFQPIFKNLINWPYIQLKYINIIHHKRFHPKISPIILVLYIYMHIFKLCDGYYFVTNIFHILKILQCLLYF